MDRSRWAHTENTHSAVCWFRMNDTLSMLMGNQTRKVG